MMEAMANTPIFLSRPYLDEEDIQAVVDVLRSGNLVQGDKVLKLEQNINDLTGSKFSSAVSNGTASLHLALLALGIGQGDEVIVPAFSYIATGNAVELTGAKPVFVDVHLETFNIDESKLEAAITSHTKCIMPVHEFGLCANMEVIMAIAAKHKLFVVEDAACAIGASHYGKFAGTFGDFGSFSLHPRKSVTSGEGGILTTQNPALDRKIKTLRNHGIAPDRIPMEFVAAGFNYRLTDFQAALVSSQMRRLQQIFQHKNELVELYNQGLKQNGIVLPSVPDGNVHSWQTFHILCKDEYFRNSLIDHLKSHQIFTNYGAQCIPAMTYYKEKYKYDVAKLFPNSFKAYTCGLALPMSERLTKEEVQAVINRINQFTNDQK
ncbi:DegT/DnrJ/EryC1/StrS family aminotransferase [Algoriphagus jejuensis]|uniref:DegT/DnrJ/EryC1/StrS family aminotransferase n=1 Tax=Algoriphagus jejuensis TaxID=419934 RepID=A0ABN1N4S9_9BACT